MNFEEFVLKKEEFTQVGHANAHKYLKNLESSGAKIPDHVKDLVYVAFYAGFVSGVSWTLPNSREAPIDSKMSDE